MQYDVKGMARRRSVGIRQPATKAGAVSAFLQPALGLVEVSQSYFGAGDESGVCFNVWFVPRRLNPRVPGSIPVPRSRR